MDDKLLIPEKIKVGYQERSDTYTKKLAYVIYYDTKGVLRKETSWQGWRDKKIPFDDIENVPTEGFVLNKGVGGQRQSYGWNARNEYIRVYDPRNFEFEISVANLLFILQECTATKGKGLEGEFVYAWSGKELVLLPAGSQEYKVSTEFTALQNTKIGARDLKPGCSYLTKDMNNLTYIGRFMYYKTDYISRNSYDYVTSGKKGHIFYDENAYQNGYSGKKGKFIHLKSMNKLAKLNSDVEVSNYADIMELFNSTKHSSPTVDIESSPMKIDFDKVSKNKSSYNHEQQIETFIENGDGSFDKITISENKDYHSKDLKGYSVHFDNTYKMGQNGLMVKYSDFNDSDESSRIKHPKFINIEKKKYNYKKDDNVNRYWSHRDEFYLTKEQVNAVDYAKLRIKLGNGKLAKPSQFATRDY